MTIYERILRLERQTKNLNKNICCLNNGGGDISLRWNEEEGYIEYLDPDDDTWHEYVIPGGAQDLQSVLDQGSDASGVGDLNIEMNSMNLRSVGGSFQAWITFNDSGDGKMHIGNDDEVVFDSSVGFLNGAGFSGSPVLLHTGSIVPPSGDLRRLMAINPSALSLGAPYDQIGYINLGAGLSLTGGTLNTTAPATPSGVATLVGGDITVATTAITASSKVFVSVATPGGVQGFLSVPPASIVAGISFKINSTSVAETSTVNWWIID